ncbi:MAG: lipase family protein [Chitinivibrionales bacterium]|nr:lipase family protein [Chitinivibrionales bacterium]
MNFRILLLAGLLVCAAYAKSSRPPFDPGDSISMDHSIDFPEILNLALLSHFAYKPDSVITRYYTAMDLSIGTLASEKVKYIIIRDGRNNLQTIAIQGTKNFHNIVLDMEFSERVDPLLGVKLHRGFEKTARELYDQLILTKALDKAMPVIITGHSLGGAAGVILALYLQQAGFTIRKVVTFGQPRITDGTGARQFCSIPLLRVVNSKDAIPFLPPDKKNKKTADDRYIHFGREVVLLRERFFAYREDPVPSNDRDLTLWEDLTEENLKEHHLKNYLSNLVMKLSEPREVGIGQIGRY